MVMSCTISNFIIVSYHRGSRDASSEDFEASDGGEA
jgi:hypothetical protein